MITRKALKAFALTLMLALVFKIAVAQNQSRATPRATIDSIAGVAGMRFMGDTARVCLSIGVYDHGQYATYHFANKPSNIPGDQSLYEIGSITKTMTGTLLAKAVVDGKVKLDDDIRKYLDGQYPNLEFQGNPIRLFHLLNHSSGLPFDMPADDAQRAAYTRANFYSDLHKVKLDTIPGIKLAYSNSAAQLLGFILEGVYKKPFESLMRDSIFAPLKMQSTGITLAPNQSANLLNGYTEQGEIASVNQSGTAGGVRSSIVDMLQFIRFELNESDAVVALSHRPTWGNILYYAIGLNWQMDQRGSNPRRIFQSGGTAGFSSNITIYPDLQFGIILLSNQADKTAQDKLGETAQLLFSVFPKQ